MQQHVQKKLKIFYKNEEDFKNKKILTHMNYGWLNIKIFLVYIVIGISSYNKNNKK